MVSTGVCFNGTGRLHFVAAKAKINADYYVCELLPNLVDDCELLMLDGNIFQQDGAPAHTSMPCARLVGAGHAGLEGRTSGRPSGRTSGRPTPQTLIRSTFTSGKRCYTDTSSVCRSLKASRNCKKC